MHEVDTRDEAPSNKKWFILISELLAHLIYGCLSPSFGCYVNLYHDLYTSIWANCSLLYYSFLFIKFVGYMFLITSMFL